MLVLHKRTLLGFVIKRNLHHFVNNPQKFFFQSLAIYIKLCVKNWLLVLHHVT